MAHDNPVAQKLRGKAQKAIGEYQIQTGHGIKGGISKAKGELNERLADARMKFKGTKEEVKEKLDDTV